jgi:aryl-alcohol dehydrogenase-like predicted oxidoreductase
MEKRKLGNTGLEIVPLVFGGNVFGWTADENTSFALLDAWVDRGFNAIDTANVYSSWVPGHQGGESEAIIGKWFARTGKRNSVMLATKVGMEMPGDGKGLKKSYILQQLEKSLQRLQTDVIDLYQSHKDDEGTPFEETLEAYAQLLKDGKVRAIGASNYKGARLSAAIEAARNAGLPVYQTLQPDYNLYDRQDYETDLAPVAERYGLGVIPYFSLASGFLTGKYQSLEDTEGKSRESRVRKYFDDRGKRILKALKDVADETGAEQASVALAWSMAQPTITAPIASATGTKQLDALFAAVDLKLTEAQSSPMHNPQIQFTQLCVAYRCRRIDHHVDRLRRFGERNHFAQRSRARQNHHNAIEPQRNAPVRWRAVLQCIQKEAEAVPGFFIAHAQRAEYLRLHVLAMDTNRARAQLRAVQHHVIGQRTHRALVVVERA